MILSGRTLLLVVLEAIFKDPMHCIHEKAGRHEGKYITPANNRASTDGTHTAANIAHSCNWSQPLHGQITRTP